jgi:(p)ppGpp synthase/HD superfamily hydrolase
MTYALYTQALIFAAQAHDGQQRKYTGLPYITHPIAVAEIVRMAHGTDEMVAAALLHDVIEDCNVPIEMLRYHFGDHVAKLVGMLTDPKVEGNRAVRKAAARDQLAQASAAAQTIKVADLLDNTSSIVEHDPKFAQVYLAEKLELLAVLDRAKPGLRAEAIDRARFALSELRMKEQL